MKLMIESSELFKNGLIVRELSDSSSHVLLMGNDKQTAVYRNGKILVYNLDIETVHENIEIGLNNGIPLNK